MPFDKQFNKYFPYFKKAEDMMKHMNNYKYNKNTETDIKEAKVNAHTCNEDMIKYIQETKATLLQTILNNIEKDKIEKASKQRGFFWIASCRLKYLDVNNLNYLCVNIDIIIFIIILLYFN